MEPGLILETAGGATYAPDWEAVAALAKKMATLMASVGQIKKDAKNKFLNYDYLSYEALAAHVRTALVEAGLAFTVSASNVESQRGETDKGKESMTRLMVLELSFTDTVTGAMRIIRGYGEGSDSQDKATAKALTSGVKYLLMRNLLVSEDADVDSDSDKPQRVQTVGEPEPEVTEDGNGQESGEAPKWTPAFWGWFKDAMESFGIGDRQQDTYQWLKDEKYMKEHLNQYDKIGEAQGDAIKGFKVLQQQKEA